MDPQQSPIKKGDGSPICIYVHYGCREHVMGFRESFLSRLQTMELRLLRHTDLVEKPQLAQNVDVIFIHGQSNAQWVEERLDQFTNCKLVANHGVGVNHLNLRKYRNHNIRVTNTPDVLNESMAELTIGLMIISARKLVAGRQINRAMSETAEPYKVSEGLGMLLSGSTVGIVGMGKVGMEVAMRCHAFGMTIVYHNRNKRSLYEEAKAQASYEPKLCQLLQKSDVVILCCDLNDQTRNLMSKEQFGQMKNTAVLVNVSRGEVVDQNALVEALQNNEIGAAALDVTNPEPLPIDHPLRSFTNVFLTPHLGSATEEARTAMENLMVDNVRALFSTGKLVTEVQVKDS